MEKHNKNFVNTPEAAETYTHTHTHTHTGKPCLAFFVAVFISVAQSFASGISATNGVAQPSTCDTNTLETSTGPAKLRAEFTPEIIKLRWYNDDTRVTVPTASNTCTYGTAISLPQNPTKPGYKFAGWEVIQDYKQIQYLQSTGTQSIDTGYVPIAGTKMEIRASFYDANGHACCACGTAPLGAYGRNSYFSPLCTSSNTIIYYFNSYHYTSMTMSYNDIIVASITVNNENTSANVVINNETRGTQATYNQTGYIQTPTSIRLFSGGASNNNKPIEFSKLKLYYAKIWQNGVLVRNFIPVVDLSGTPCMYDTVENNFYYNDAYNYYDDDSYKQDFVAGPDL